MSLVWPVRFQSWDMSSMRISPEALHESLREKQERMPFTQSDGRSPVLPSPETSRLFRAPKLQEDAFLGGEMVEQ